MNSLSKIIVRLRHSIIIMVTAITLLMAYFMKDLEVNPDAMSYLIEEDASVRLFRQIADDYKGTDLIIVGIEGEDVFTHQMLTVIVRITDSILSVPGVEHATSLVNAIDIRDTEYGLEIGPLVDRYNIPENKECLDSLRSIIRSNDSYAGKLVSLDNSSTIVIAKVMPHFNRIEITESIKQKTESIPFEGTIFYGGMPVTLMELNRIIISDIINIVPITFVLICFVLFAGFRSFRGVFLPMLTVIVATIWIMGLISLLGYKVTLLTNAIPLLLLAIGNDYAIHVVNAVVVEQQINPYRALHRAIRYIMMPIILASVTTMMGFFSFIAGSSLVMIREFAMFSIAGIFFTLILTLFFLPAVMAVMNKKGQKPVKNHNLSFSDVIPAKILRASLQHQKVVFLFWSVVVLISIVGITRVTRSVDVIDYFQDSSIAKQGESILSEKFYGSNPLYIRFSGDLQCPDVLNRISDTQAYMQGFSYIPNSYSVADLIKQLHSALGGDFGIPDKKETIVQLYFLLDGQQVMEQLVRPDFQQGIIHGFVNSTELVVLDEIHTNFNEFTAKHSDENLKIEVTGIPILLKELDDKIVRSQIQSLVMAIVFVIILTSLLIGSVRKGLLAIIPVAVTLFTLFGVMGITGVPIDIATMLTGSVTIGIGIDFSIHFISRFGEGQRVQPDTRKSLERAMQTSGKSIFISMLSIIAGMTMFVFTSLVPTQRLGLLLAFTMLIAGLATLSLLPVLLIRFNSKKMGT